MTSEEALEVIRNARISLDKAERDADLTWRDKVAGMRAQFARDVQGALDAIDDDDERPF